MSLMGEIMGMIFSVIAIAFIAWSLYGVLTPDIEEREEKTND